MNLSRLFHECDCSLLEVNPLVVTTAGNIHCLDAKVNIDGNALFRQKRLAAMHDPSQEDEREGLAAKFNLNYVALDGNIGCMVNGAGLAMGTMDLVKTHGGQPANFLDVGGSASKESVGEAFKIILSDKNVKAVSDQHLRRHRQLRDDRRRHHRRGEGSRRKRSRRRPFRR